MKPPRVYIPTMKDIMRSQAQGNIGPVNHVAHEQLHGPSMFMYTSVPTLDLVAGTALRLPRGGEITRISGRVSGAPSGGDLKIVILANGASILGSGFLRVLDGTNVTKERTVERTEFNEDTRFQVQIDTLSGATGPLVVVFEYLPEF